MGARIERFCKTTRWLHWSFVTPFLVLAATGAVLALRDTLALAPPRVARLVAVHQTAGVVMLAAPTLVLLSGRTEEALRDLREVFRWSRDDLRWLALQPLALLGRAALPPAGKLNAGQKLNAMMTMGLAAGLVATGVWTWREPGALAPWFVHLTLAAAWVPLFAGHMWLAVLNPGTRPALRGMLLGEVDRAWALHHHPRWAATAPAARERVPEEVPEPGRETVPADGRA